MIDRQLVLALAMATASFVSFAQSGNRLTEPAGLPPSRWQAEIDQLDQALRDRTLVATQPRAQWVAGQLDTADPASRVAHFAQARTQVPAEKLYVASLATACLEPVRPLPPECDATDRLADWATRDTENGVPSMLLADRARVRNDGPAMVAYLEEAAMRPRFDDYWNRGALFLWEEVRALPMTADPAARAEFTAMSAAARVPFTALTLPFLCRDAQRFGESVRAACSAAGAAMAQRGTTWALRTVGAQLAERSAAAPEAQAAAGRLLADLRLRAYECAEAANPVIAALESPDAAVRSGAVAQWQARLRTEADVGEVAACARATRKAGG
jgi:hypothetical protein